MFELLFWLALVALAVALLLRVARDARVPCCPGCRRPNVTRDLDLPSDMLPFWYGEKALTNYVFVCCEVCGTVLVTGIYVVPPKEVVDA